ncbi:MAG: DotU family type IV/VI secretion system protein [Acidobacteria bacterium]|nr:DotU family type IV/VI secretion system protein [Acidobacteriota bacterium]
MEGASLLFRAVSPLFLWLVSFRRKVKRGVRLELSEVKRQLEELFAELGREAQRDPRLEALYDKARYPLVVLADETILQSGWQHAASWENALLEERFFGTNVGGEKYFSIANDIRSDQIELASVLYTGLTLGFAGKYRDRPEKLSEVRKKLYRMLAEYIAPISSERITPDAYHVAPKEPRRLSPVVTLVRVMVISLGMLVFYWIGTWGLWKASVTGIQDSARAMGVVK